MAHVYYDNTANEAIQQQIGQVNNALSDYARLDAQKKANQINQALAYRKLAQEQQEQDARLRQQQIETQARLDAQKFSQGLQTEKFAYDQYNDAENRKLTKANQDRMQQNWQDQQDQQDFQFRARLNQEQGQRDYAAQLVAQAKQEGRDLTPEESVRAFGKLPEQMSGANAHDSLQQRQYEFDVRRAERNVVRAQKALDAVTYNEQKHMLTGRSESLPEAPKGMEKVYQAALQKLAEAENELDNAEKAKAGLVGAAQQSGGLVGSPAPSAPPGSKGPLSRDLAREILYGPARGDKNLARQIAQQLGYVIPQGDTVPAVGAPGLSQ